MKRAAATGLHTANILFLSTWFAGSITIEGVHPLECGALRRKFRHARRPELGLESPLLFYPRYWAETVIKLARWARLYARYGRQYLRIERDPNRFAYTDQALTPVSAEDGEFEMFQSAEAVAFVKQEQRLERARHGDFTSAAE